MPRRSSTNAFAPRFCSRFSAAYSSACAPELNCARRTTPALHAPARAICDATTGTDTVLRVIVFVKRLPPRSQVTFTSDPGGPLMKDTASSELRPESLWPAASTMMSPFSIPARLAGEPS